MMQYLSVLILHVQRRVESEKGGIISIKPRHVCGGDRRCGMAVRWLMISLVEKGLARQHKRGVFLIERRAVEEVLKVVKQCGGCPPGGLRSRKSTRPRRGGVRRVAE